MSRHHTAYGSRARNNDFEFFTRLLHRLRERRERLLRLRLQGIAAGVTAAIVFAIASFPTDSS